MVNDVFELQVRAGSISAHPGQFPSGTSLAHAEEVDPDTYLAELTTESSVI